MKTLEYHCLSFTWHTGVATSLEVPYKRITSFGMNITTQNSSGLYQWVLRNVACENSRPSSLQARVAFRVKDETPLGPGAKKDGCFRRLCVMNK